MVSFGQKWLYSGKSGCIQAKVVLFGQNWLYSGKIGCIRAKVGVVGQNSCIRQSCVFVQKWLYSVEKVFIRVEWLFSGKSGFNRAKWL